MAKYELKLVNSETGKTEIFEKDFISVRKTQEALRIIEEQEKSQSELETFNSQVAFIASVFNDVTVDMVLDGLDASTGMDTLNSLFFRILGYDEKKIQTILEKM